MGIKGFKLIVKPTEDVVELKRLIDQWREPALLHVRSCDVVPDTSNRSHTGLSVDHVHFIASNILKHGFRSRDDGGGGPAELSAPQSKGDPHDVPVYVRASPSCKIASESLGHWKDAVKDEPGFPRFTITPEQGFFVSLGNGHFTQALNLYRQQIPSVFTGERFEVPAGDGVLRLALSKGVQAIVLRQETSIVARRRISALLNSTHDYKWTVNQQTGEMDIRPEVCSNAQFSQFEAQCKVADSEALTALVRIELGAGMDERTALPNLASKL